MKPPRKIDAARHSNDLLAQAHRWSGEDTHEPQPHERIPLSAWTLDNIRSAANIACSRVRYTPGMLRESNLHDVALSAIGIAIALDPDITVDDAIYQGQRALLKQRDRTLRSVGFTPTGEPRSRYWKYWLDEPPRFPAPTRCEERIALAQVLVDLPEKHAETLLVYAFADSGEEAADLLEVSRDRFRKRLIAARAAAFELWFDGEDPPPVGRLALKTPPRTHCARGHELLDDNRQLIMRNGRQQVRCRTCLAWSRDTKRGKHS